MFMKLQLHRVITIGSHWPRSLIFQCFSFAVELEKWLIQYENGGYLDAKQCVTPEVYLWVLTLNFAFYNHDIFADLKLNDWKHHHHQGLSSPSSFWWPSSLVVSLSDEMMTFYSVFKGYFCRMRMHPRLSTAVAAFQTAPFFIFPSVCGQTQPLSASSLASLIQPAAIKPLCPTSKHFVILTKTTNV